MLEGKHNGGRVLLLVKNKAYAGTLAASLAAHDPPWAPKTVKDVIDLIGALADGPAPIVAECPLLPEKAPLIPLGGAAGPIILLVDSWQERRALLQMRAGAADFLLKSPDLALGLPAVVERAWDAWKRKKETNQVEIAAVAEDLRASRRHLELAVSVAELAIWDGDLLTQAATFNRDVWANHLDLRPDEIEPNFDFMIRRIHPEDRELVRTKFADHLSGATPFFKAEYRLLAGDGTYRWVFTRGQVFERDPDGTPRRVIGANIHITERKRLETRLRESELLYHELVDTASDGICIIQDERVVFVNPRLAEMLGLPESDCLGREFAEFISPDEHDHIRMLYERYFANNERELGIIETKLCRAGEGCADVELNAGQIQYNGRRAMIVNIRDVTDRRRVEAERSRLEAQLYHAQKMEVFGRLAAGIAHDFNNLLTGVRGYTDIVASTLPAGHPNRADLTEIVRATDRARLLTGRLSILSRVDKPRSEVVDLARLLASIRETIAPLIGENVRVELRGEAAPTPVRVDTSQLEQVLFNLAINSRDAMPQGGTIELGLARVDLDEDFCRLRPGLAAGAHAAIHVADSGVGMDDTVRRQAFEPFFTTKPTGTGTGLGLPTARAIVQHHGGHIELESAPNRGTTVRIYLPIVREEPVELEAVPPAAGDRTTILVVEDEPMVLMLTRRILDRAGYHVLVAHDAENAGEIFARYEGDVRLLLTDVMMPGETGEALADRLRTRQPDLPVLFMTGHTRAQMGQRDDPARGMFVISKPFSVDALTRAVRHALGAADDPDDESPCC